jgi:uncharacterized protein (TIGR03067 family)
MAGTRWARCFGLAALALLTTWGGVARAGGKSDRDLFQGDWVVATAVLGGEELPAALVMSFKANFTGDVLKLEALGDTYKATVKLDESKKPKTVDLKIEDKTRLGIYAFDGDKVKVCLADAGQPRPTEFKSPAKSETLLVVFKRSAAKKKDAKKKATAAPARGAVVFLGDKEKKGKTDQDAIQGKWVLASGEKEGEKAPPEIVGKVFITFTGDKLAVSFGENKEGTFKLDPSKKPKAIDLSVGGKNIRGIYKLEGDTFTICANEPDKDGRPGEFKTGPGSGTVLMVLKRVKPGCADEHPVAFVAPGDKKGKTDQELIQGKWVVASGEKDGKEAPADIVGKLAFTFEGGTLTVRAGEQAKFKLDATKKPKAIDITIEGKGDVKGIYELTGDTLKLCVGEPGTERPTEFKSPAGSRAVYVVFKRAKKGCDDEFPVAFVEPGDKKKDKTDKELLQGSWKLVSGVHDGKDVPQELIDKFKMTFTGDKVSVDIGNVIDGDFKHDPKAKPKTIDLNIMGKDIQGIYVFEGDNLKICLKQPDSAGRPKEFQAPAGSEDIYLVLKRAKGCDDEHPVLFVAGGDKKEKKTDQERLQGTWKLASGQKGGKEAPPEILKAFRLSFAGDKFTLEVGNPTAGTYKIDPKAKPKAIDFTAEGKTVPGIYQFDGDTLRVCINEVGNDRPKEFKSAAGDSIINMVLKREPGEKSDKPRKEEKGQAGAFGPVTAADFAACCAEPGEAKGKTDRDVFQGEWDVVDAEKGGEKIPENFRKDIHVKFAGDKVVLDIVGDKKDGSFKLDASKKPRTIDLTIEDKTALGIYELSGDTLKVRMAEPGSARPKDFGSTAGTDDSMVVLKRKAAGGKADKSGGEVKVGPKTDRDRLQGVWKAVGLEVSGKKQDASELAAMRVLFVGDQFKMVPSGFADHEEGTFKIDATKSPPHIDITLRGETMQAIYRLEGDKLTICGSEPGAKLGRPTQFRTADSKVGMIVLERAKNERPDGFTANAQISMNNLRQIGLAMHSYHDVHLKMPGAAIYSKDGKPLLSWRVALLPYLEQDGLYRQFKLDEPWDSEHNKKLIAQMPAVFTPHIGAARKTTLTPYRVFTGKSTPFEGFGKDIKLDDFADGTSNTVLVVEAAEQVPWTKPDDLPFDAKKPLPKLGGRPFMDRFHVLMGDGTVQSVSAEFDADIFRALITPNGNEPVNFDMLNLPKKKEKEGKTEAN